MSRQQSRNLDLAVAIARDGRRSYLIAASAEVHPATFSGILTGRVEPTSDQRRRIAAALNAEVHTIFPDINAQWQTRRNAAAEAIA